MGRGRRLAAAASLLASAGGFAWLALQHGSGWFDPRALAFGGGLAAASFGLTRKNLFAQIMSRGLAWVLFAPCAVVIFVELLKGRMMEPELTGFGLASGLALFLARPMLDTAEARAQFSPSKFRFSFLAACTAAVTTGLVTGMIAFEMLGHRQWLGGIGLAMLGTSILASAFGVLRMRGWGIALATVNAIVSIVAGAFAGNAEGVALAATALPGLLFLSPIVLAKLGFGETARERMAATRSFARIADEDALPARVRVATDDDVELEEEAQTQEPRKTTDVPELTRGISLT
jgi:hypothetical protein